MKEKYEGYWRNSSNPHLPFPKAHTLPWDGKERFLADLAKVEADKADEVSYRGMSRCRICDVTNGSREFHFRNWIWPAGYRHYIENHNVIPTGEFAQMITKEAA